MSLFQKSGLSTAIGGIFLHWQGIPMWALVMCLCLVTAAFTEITSNTATATIFLPILAELVNNVLLLTGDKNLCRAVVESEKVLPCTYSWAIFGNGESIINMKNTTKNLLE